MPGVLTMLYVDEGAEVEEGDRVCEIELMKTLFPLVATASGVVHFLFNLGEIVAADDVVATVTEV
jgi:biotin carboxyl carrier protein